MNGNVKSMSTTTTTTRDPIEWAQKVDYYKIFFFVYLLNANSHVKHNVVQMLTAVVVSVLLDFILCL